MSTFLIISVIVVGLILLKLLANIFISKAIPVEITGYTLLEQEIKSYGIDPIAFPEEFKRDVVSLAISISEIKHMTDPRGSAFKSELVEWIKHYASMIHIYNNNLQSTLLNDQENPLANLINKHNLKQK